MYKRIKRGLILFAAGLLVAAGPSAFA